MNDEKIFKISLITTAIGLVMLLLLSGYVNPENLTIDRIDKSKIDNQIEVEAMVSKITTTNSGTIIISLDDGTDTINLVAFPSAELSADEVKKGMNIRVIARVTPYHDDLELVLEENGNLAVV
jgi:RecJ-like exonuclease